MPGIVGFSKKYIEELDARNTIKRMQDLITHNDFYAKDSLYIDKFVCATRSHTNIIQKEPQPYIGDGLYIWMDGEFYNQDDIIKEYGIAAKTDLEILSKLYKNNNSLLFLKQINGIFSAVIYDSNINKLYLISDRYGLRHLYFSVWKRSLIWSSEVKSILAFPNFNRLINKRSVEQLCKIGYLLENNTLFENIELIPSGSILIWDLNSDTLNMHRYWWWSEIKPMLGRVDEKEISEELGRLFINSVKSRCLKQEKIGLFLSGGLDSRAILAAMPVYNAPIHAITFGKRDCDDILIASMVTKIKGAQHHIYELNHENWLMPRIKGVWLTDGHMDLMHMHGIETQDFVRQFFDINQNGFAGDLILGGSYLKNRRCLDREVTKELVAEILNCEVGMIDNCAFYKGLNKMDYYFLQNRVRRFTFAGTKLSLSMIENRKPFYDNKLIEFAYSLPDSLRFNHHIYNLMLIKWFPEFYLNIPWQKTGVTINSSYFKRFAIRVRNKIAKEVISGLFKLGIKVGNNRGYVDYPNWIREEPARSLFQRILSNPNALYCGYISKKNVLTDLRLHLEGKDRADILCRYLTFEIWLQQVFNGEYRE